MDVFLFPSCWEGLGLAVVEALAAGLPVVASRLEAIEEAVEGTPTRCFTPGDYDAAARHVLDLLAVDAPDKAAFAPSSPFLSRFDMNTCVGALREIYES
jgi:glycosyltransferase involved in cell wall biosynthesis